jgi:hypothetical protein
LSASTRASTRISLISASRRSHSRVRRGQSFPFFGIGPFGQRQGDAQSGQGERSSWDIAQQLALAADQALQARTHAVEVVGQHAELVATVGQFRQAVLLVGGLPQIMHRAAQTAERAGDGQGHEQAEQGQYHQGDPSALSGQSRLSRCQASSSGCGMR